MQGRRPGHSDGARVDVADGYGQRPIHFACRDGHLDLALWLVAQGADIGETTHTGGQPLHFACGFGHLEVVQRLVAQQQQMEAELCRLVGMPSILLEQQQTIKQLRQQAASAETSRQQQRAEEEARVGQLEMLAKVRPKKCDSCKSILYNSCKRSQS